MGKVTIAFTGHRPKDLPSEFGYDYSAKSWKETKEIIKLASKLLKVTNFIAGGAQGFDTAAALAVLEMREKENPEIKLQIECPFRGQELGWGEEAQKLYTEINEKANIVNFLSDNYKGKYLYQRRNEIMVDQADYIFAFWNGKKYGGTYNTVSYARKKGKPVINLYNILRRHAHED